MNDTLKRIAYHRLAPIGLVLLAAAVTEFAGLHPYLIVIACAVVAVGAYGQVGFGVVPRKKATLRVL